jgi:hypothetical protein
MRRRNRIPHDPKPRPDYGQFVHLVSLSGGKSPSGVTKEREQFFDDSSKALGIGKATTGKPARGGDRVAPFAGALQKRDIEERALIEANESSDREKEIQKLLARGQAYTHSQAAEIVDRERARTPADRKQLRALERELAHEREMASLRDENKKPVKHGGSKSGRRSEGKKGTWICKSCHLEKCEHRPKSRGGRPPESSRSLCDYLRMSPLTKDTLRKAGIGTSDMAEIFANAWRNGTTLQAEAAVFLARNPKKRRPAA